jgi:hypothetical protein
LVVKEGAALRSQAGAVVQVTSEVTCSSANFTLEHDLLVVNATGGSC